MALAAADTLQAPAAATRGRFGRGTPASVQARYRDAQPLLFTDLQAGAGVTVDSGLVVTPPRAGIAAPVGGFVWGQYGPHRDNVDHYTRWAWANAGGDWINTAGTPQALTLPHWTFAANTVTSGSFTYSVTVTAAVEAARVAGRWNAWIVKLTGGMRGLASQNHGSLPPPSIAVTYTDGSTATLICRACVRLAVGTAYTQIGHPEQLIDDSLALEFDRATKPVASAVMSVPVVQHTGTASTISGYLANPPTTPRITVQGIAANYPQDIGLAAHSAVLVAHRYADGSTLGDHLLLGNSVNVFNRTLWNPQVLGLGAADTTKLPTAHAGTTLNGKWLQKQHYPENISLVQSSHTADGFVPLVPGMAALRIVIPASTLPDGGAQGPTGSTGVDLWSLFAEAVSGTDALRRTFVRFYLRIASVPKRVADMRMLRETGTAAEFAYQHGKFGMGVHHWTNRGGNNLNGGGGLGWSHRLGFDVVPAEAPLAGLLPFSHTVDNGVPDMRWGAGGGMGSALYPHRWYCIEIETNLNTWAPAGGGPADGQLRVWIDGVQVCQHTGWKFRDGPLDPPGAGIDMPPFRAMAPMGLTVNFYQGGRIAADQELVAFLTADAAATQYIGPINITAPVGPVLPSWVPAASSTHGAVVAMTVANSKLANNWIDSVTPWHSGYFWATARNAYSGARYNRHYGPYGTFMFMGEGHSAGNDNTVNGLHLEQNQVRFGRITDGSAPFGKGTDITTRDKNSFANFDHTSGGAAEGTVRLNGADCTFVVDGQPAGHHSYNAIGVIPPSAGGGAKGSLYLPLLGAAGRNTALTTSSITSFRLDLTSEATPTENRLWTKLFTHPTYPNATADGGSALLSVVNLPVHGCYDEPSNRYFWQTRNASVSPRWQVPNAGSAAAHFVQGTGTALDATDFGIASHMAVHIPERRLWVMLHRSQATGFLKVKYIDLSAAQPGWVNSGASLSLNIPVDTDWTAACSCPDIAGGRILVFDTQGKRAAYFEITVPTNLNSVWTAEEVPTDQTLTTLLASGARQGDNGTIYGACDYAAPTKCVLLCCNVSNTTGVPDTVFAIRPRGV